MGAELALRTGVEMRLRILLLDRTWFHFCAFCVLGKGRSSQCFFRWAVENYTNHEPRIGGLKENRSVKSPTLSHQPRPGWGIFF